MRKFLLGAGFGFALATMIGFLLFIRELALAHRELNPNPSEYKDVLDKDYSEMVILTQDGEYEFRGNFTTIPDHLKRDIFSK